MSNFVNKNNAIKKSHTDIKVEILRIIACISVIWYHIRSLPWKTDGTMSETAVFFECVCTICVMIFFLISGFYIYDKKGNLFKDWISIITKFLKTVFLPFILVVIFVVIFQDFLISKCSFVECLQNTSFKYVFDTIFNSFKHYDVNFLPGAAGHLWYIYSYMIILAVYPITRIILRRFDRKLVYAIIIVFLILMILNDYYLFYGNPKINIFFQICHKPIFYSAWGNLLYNDVIKKFIVKKEVENKTIIINKPLFSISILIYCITFVLLFFTQSKYNMTTNQAYVYTSWLSTFSLILTSAFVLVVYNVNILPYITKKIEKIIYFISSRTLEIYLIHYLIITKLLSCGFQQFVSKDRPNFLAHLWYHIWYSFFILVLTFIFILLVEFVISKIKFLFGKNTSNK